jgi:hypothetical protein
MYNGKIINKKRSLSDDFEEMILNLDKMEENLIDLKKLSSLDEIVSLTNKPSNHHITLTRQLNEVNIFINVLMEQF